LSHKLEVGERRRLAPCGILTTVWKMINEDAVSLDGFEIMSKSHDRCIMTGAFILLKLVCACVTVAVQLK